MHARALRRAHRPQLHLLQREDLRARQHAQRVHGAAERPGGRSGLSANHSSSPPLAPPTIACLLSRLSSQSSILEPAFPHPSAGDKCASSSRRGTTFLGTPIGAWETYRSPPIDQRYTQTDSRFEPIPAPRSLHAPLRANRNFPLTRLRAPTHPALKPLACSQARTSEASECRLSCGSGARGPGTAARLGTERPWARRTCSSSFTLSIWENFSAGEEPGGRQCA